MVEIDLLCTEWVPFLAQVFEVEIEKIPGGPVRYQISLDGPWVVIPLAVDLEVSAYCVHIGFIPRVEVPCEQYDFRLRVSFDQFMRKLDTGVCEYSTGFTGNHTMQWPSSWSHSSLPKVPFPP
jgi:hypothetical protein